MVQFGWINMSLFVILVLLFTAVTGQTPPSFTVRVGDEVTLPCENVIENQHKCDSTSWLVSHYIGASAGELVTLGQISKATSDRLSITAKCSLVIKNVTIEDFGRYTCRQFNTLGKQQGPVSWVYLSVISIYENKNNDVVTLLCTVLTYKGCGYTVQWLYEGNKNGVETSQLSCSAIVTFTTPHLNQKSNYYELLKCNVMDNKSGKVQLVTVSSQSSGEDSTKTTPAAEFRTTASPIFNSTAQEARTDCSVLNYIMLVMRVAELLLITVITVLLIRARGNQRPPDDNTVFNSVRSRTVKRSGPAASQVNDDEDEDDGVVNYENDGDTSASVRLH